MKLILNMFKTDMLIEFVVDLLAGFIKNPDSDKARRIRSVVEKLHNATAEFLERVH